MSHLGVMRKQTQSTHIRRCSPPSEERGMERPQGMGERAWGAPPGMMSRGGKKIWEDRRPATRVTAEDPWRNAPGGAGDEAVARGRDGGEPTGARYDARRLGRVPPRLGGDGPLEGVDARQGLAARALPEAARANRRRCRAHGHVPPGVPHGGRVSLLPEEFDFLAAPRLRRPADRRRHLRLRGGD